MASPLLGLVLISASLIPPFSRREKERSLAPEGGKEKIARVGEDIRAQRGRRAYGPN